MFSSQRPGITIVEISRISKIVEIFRISPKIFRKFWKTSRKIFCKKLFSPQIKFYTTPTDESVISNPKRSNFDGKGDFLVCWWRSPCSISVASYPIWMCSGIFDTYSFQFVQKSSLCIHQNSAKYRKYHRAPAGFNDFPLYRCVTLCTLAKLEITKSCRGSWIFKVFCWVLMDT